ncbi:unnamed protein product [Ilex paraguariensis]|uniref:EF-hand domain-containing protein n=1 Tax=Ilex paraguariensis TaxID=185542 RepID=A0ABC8UUD6_9AQUA
MATNPNHAPTVKPTMCLQDMDEVNQVFNRFDVNGDGKISATELSDVMKALGSDTSADELSCMMSEIDTDKDGFINLQEFASFLKTSQNDDVWMKELRDAFELYDQDKDGVITAAELHQILTRLGEICSVQDCARMIKSVDSDGDGNVNFEEFQKMMTNTKA